MWYINSENKYFYILPATEIAKASVTKKHAIAKKPLKPFICQTSTNFVEDYFTINTTLIQ